jgi:hypothetical protein
VLVQSVQRDGILYVTRKLSVSFVRFRRFSRIRYFAFSDMPRLVLRPPRWPRPTACPARGLQMEYSLVAGWAGACTGRGGLGIPALEPAGEAVFRRWYQRAGQGTQPASGEADSAVFNPFSGPFASSPSAVGDFLDALEVASTDHWRR